MIKKISVDNVDIYYEENVIDSNVVISCSSDDDNEWITQGATPSFNRNYMKFENGK